MSSVRLPLKLAIYLTIYSFFSLIYFHHVHCEQATDTYTRSAAIFISSTSKCIKRSKPKIDIYRQRTCSYTKTTKIYLGIEPNVQLFAWLFYLTVKF